MDSGANTYEAPKLKVQSGIIRFGNYIHLQIQHIIVLLAISYVFGIQYHLLNMH